MTFIYKPRSGFAGRLFERFVRYAVTSDAVDRILLTTRAEAPRYAETFGLPLSRFGFAHCGSIPHDPAAYDDPALKAQATILPPAAATATMTSSSGRPGPPGNALHRLRCPRPLPGTQHPGRTEPVRRGHAAPDAERQSRSLRL